jgi:hypothetical protein
MCMCWLRGGMPRQHMVVQQMLFTLRTLPECLFKKKKEKPSGRKGRKGGTREEWQSVINKNKYRNIHPPSLFF